MSAPVATTPEPPYYAVIFTAEQTDDLAGYAEVVAQMQVRAAENPGYLGLEGAQQGRSEITVSYWRDLESLQAWRRQVDHLAAQRLGRERWYSAYTVRVAWVERAYAFVAS